MPTKRQLDCGRVFRNARMKETKLHFQRFEFKYLLSFDEFNQIRKRLRQYVSLDGFARDSNKGFYEVISLYYDSPKFYYYYEKIDGAVRRKKIRLRAYKKDDLFAGNIFFEIKRKHDAIILKDRILMDKEQYNNFIKNESFGNIDFANKKDAQNIIEEYDQERFTKCLEPKILVGYIREPYIGTYNKNFRITFDYNIRAKISENLFEHDLDTQVLSDGVIMEIKFNGRLPYYIKEIIDQYNLERIAYSKYCHSIEACYSLPEINASRNYFFNIDKQLLTQQYERII
ncbi:MAG: hypothetical protein COW93_01160 [Parcubacteria group bacterium CG22_combo_CG10-13_8_21_14_all_41_9]|nr:MAG: hypothetical protein COW93_01160 [Parcubacteria group bacterium CG22_combo_CG10-13_8_21_14_all_41_9]